MELSDFFTQHPKAALAFSGGADSAFVLYSAAACGADIMPYYVRSQFQPAFERADARRLAAALGVPLRELEVDVLCEDTIAANPALRSDQSGGAPPLQGGRTLYVGQARLCLPCHTCADGRADHG